MQTFLVYLHIFFLQVCMSVSKCFGTALKIAAAELRGLQAHARSSLERMRRDSVTVAGNLCILCRTNEINTCILECAQYDDVYYFVFMFNSFTQSTHLFIIFIVIVFICFDYYYCYYCNYSYFYLFF
jgi:hypothetical protein